MTSLGNNSSSISRRSGRLPLSGGLTSLGNEPPLSSGSSSSSSSSSSSAAAAAAAATAASTSTAAAAAAAAAATLAATRNFLEKLNSSYALNPPRQVELRPSPGAEDLVGVWAVEKIPAGTKYGPFLGKWALEPMNPNFAWEVMVAASGIRGFLDASEYGTWLKHIQSTNGNRDARKPNVKHILLAGQIYYETIDEISSGDELLLGPKEPIHLDGKKEDEEEEEASVEGSKDFEKDDGSADEMTSEDEGDEEGVKCIKCEKLFPDIFTLDEHMIESHSYKPSQYQCEHCSKNFAWRPNLLRHKMVHGEFRRFPCENCDKVFTDPSNLQRHIRTNHVGARSHACPECGKTFATSSGLKQHTHIHSSVKPFRCEVCFKSYTQFSNLCRHKRMHANCRMQIKCHKCGQAFSTVTSLSKHRRFCDSTPSPFLAMHAAAAAAAQQQQHQQHRHDGGKGNGLSAPSSSSPSSSSSQAKLSPGKLVGEANGLHGVGGSNNSDGVAAGSLSGQIAASRAAAVAAAAASSPFYSHAAAAAAAAAAASHNLLSPFAHLLHATASGSSHFPSSANASTLNLLQNPHLLFPNVLRSLANHHLLTSSQSLTRSTAEATHSGLSAAITSAASGAAESSLRSPRTSSERSGFDRPWQGKVDTSPKRVKEKKDVGIFDAVESEKHGEPVDFNRNIAEDNKPLSAVTGKPENPLDLSVTKKEDEDSAVEEEKEMDAREEASESECKKEENGDQRDGEKKEEEEEVEEEEEEEEEEEIDEEEEVEEDEDFEVEDQEPKGFKPVKEGQSFIPIKDRVAYLQQRCEDRRDKPTESPLLNGSCMSADLSAFCQRSSTVSSGVPSYPRPVHPFLLEAMYRMHHHRPYFAPTPQHFSMSHAAAAAAAAAAASGNGPMSVRAPYFSPLTAGQEHPLMSRSSPFPALTRGYADMMPKNKDRYSCKFCGKVFPRSANLTRHLRTHTGEQPYKCKYCERSFSISSNLQRHVRNIHNKEKPFKCPLCDRSFGQQTNLDRHLKKHETCSDPSAIVDSPEGRGPEEEGYFDEIRSFMGKITDSASATSSIHQLRFDDASSPHQSEDPDIDVEEDDISMEQD